MSQYFYDLAKKHTTDKWFYARLYTDLFKDKRDSIKKVVELGIGCPKTMRYVEGPYKTGASLYMWRDYFPNAEIYGADILPEAVFQDDRIHTMQCDETKKEDLEAFIKFAGSDIDVFIDDGSHDVRKQIYTCQVVMPLLPKNVTYVLEDVVFLNSATRKLSMYDLTVPKGYHAIIIKHKQ